MKETSHFSCILSREQQEGDRVVLTCWVETLVKYIHESFLAVFSAGNSRKCVKNALPTAVNSLSTDMHHFVDRNAALVAMIR